MVRARGLWQRSAISLHPPLKRKSPSLDRARTLKLDEKSNLLRIRGNGFSPKAYVFSSKTIEISVPTRVRKVRRVE